MRIHNKKKFIVRTIEMLIILATLILTPIAIIYASRLRGYAAIGGEYFIPLLSSIILLLIESIYEESEERRKNKKWEE